MTKTEKVQFIADLTNNVARTLTEKIDRVPEEWNGIELRQWLADAFADGVSPHMMTRTRKRAYRNDVTIHNL